jgi:hypothetical protein
MPRFLFACKTNQKTDATSNPFPFPHIFPPVRSRYALLPPSVFFPSLSSSLPLLHLSAPSSQAPRGGRQGPRRHCQAGKSKPPLHTHTQPCQCVPSAPAIHVDVLWGSLAMIMCHLGQGRNCDNIEADSGCWCWCKFRRAKVQQTCARLVSL